MNKLLIAATLSILGASAFAQAPATPSASPVPSSASATSAAPAATPPAASSAAAADKHQQHAAGKFRKLDTNADGTLSRDEAAARPRLAKNFDAIDGNKDGKLTPDELKAYAQLRRSQHNAAPAKAS